MAISERFDSLRQRDWDTNPSGSVRMAVVGVGGFARDVALPAIEAADYCEPALLVSGSNETEAVGDEYGVPVIDYEAYAQGARTDDYDAVYIATPNALHLRHAETAAAHGKAVICEKPLEVTVERGERLVEACEDAGVTLMTAYRIQTDPVFRRLREFLADGGLGRLTKLHGDFTYPVLGGSRGPDQWRLDPDLAGGGALPDIGIYPLNTARFLLDADPTSATGTTAGSGPFAAVDETVSFIVTFPDDVSGVFTASFTGPTDTHLSIYGSEGRATVESAFEPNTPRRLRIETEEETIDLDGLGGEEVREEFDYFAHCVLTETAPEPDGADGLADLRTMARIYREAGSSVPLAD